MPPLNDGWDIDTSTDSDDISGVEDTSATDVEASAQAVPAAAGVAVGTQLPPPFYAGGHAHSPSPGQGNQGPGQASERAPVCLPSVAEVPPRRSVRFAQEQHLVSVVELHPPPPGPPLSPPETVPEPAGSAAASTSSTPQEVVPYEQPSQLWASTQSQEVVPCNQPSQLRASPQAVGYNAWQVEAAMQPGPDQGVLFKAPPFPFRHDAPEWHPGPEQPAGHIALLAPPCPAQRPPTPARMLVRSDHVQGPHAAGPGAEPATPAPQRLPVEAAPQPPRLALPARTAKSCRQPWGLPVRGAVDMCRGRLPPPSIAPPPGLPQPDDMRDPGEPIPWAPLIMCTDTRPNPPANPPPTRLVARAAADSAGFESMDAAFFKNFRVSGPYRRHNMALKSLREELEAQSLDERRLPDEPIQVNPVTHGEKTEFTLDTTKQELWDWRHMVAQLTNEGIDLLLSQNERVPEARCISECRFSVRRGTTPSYDHSRSCATIAQGGKLPKEQYKAWDFELLFSDGQRLRLHPGWDRRQVPVYLDDPNAPQLPPPRSGRGRSDGRGTFKKYKDNNLWDTLHFDANKA